MESFKCYEYHKDASAGRCFNQCTSCERKELLEKSDHGHIPLDMVDRMSTASSKEHTSNHPVDVAAREYVSTLPGVEYRSLYDFGKQNMEAFKKGAEWRAETSFSREEMLLFGGYCIAQKQRNPEITGSELIEGFLKMHI